MFNRYLWGEPSLKRNKLTLRYEPVQPYLILSFIRSVEAKLFFDVGANIGQYAILASSVPSVERIFAFEAETAAFAELQSNLNVNRIADVITANQVAVSNEIGEVRFGVRSPMGGNSAICETSIHGKDRYKDVRVVACTTLDAVADATGTTIALKIDVEGHEGAVIEGGRRLLSENNCLIQVEIYEGQSDVDVALQQLGYRRLLKVGPDFYYSNINALFEQRAILTIVEAAFSDLINYNLNG